MPEGPELHVAGRFVNSVSDGRIYSGKVVKSAVSTRNPDIPWDEDAYIISATTRGKEIRLTLSVAEDVSDDKKKAKKLAKKGESGKKLSILFRFGMSGKFVFKPKSEMDKHSHLNFFSRDDDLVLSFNDYRRFGRWEITDDWGKDRGPCILLEYDLFRKNVLNNLANAAFNKPICEALLNQKFFNGTGNYLRAEILFRLRIPPFTLARSVLEPLKENEDLGVKTEGDDLLKLCNLLPHEVINLNDGRGHLYDPRDDKEGFAGFLEWLQCYYQEGMNNLVDHNGRTMWFTGPAGPMKPKDTKSRGKVSRAKKAVEKAKAGEHEEAPKSKKAKKTIKTEVDVKKEPASNTRKGIKAKAEAKAKPAKSIRKTEPETAQALTPRKTPKQKKNIRGSRTQPSRSCGGKYAST